MNRPRFHRRRQDGITTTVMVMVMVMATGVTTMVMGMRTGTPVR